MPTFTVNVSEQAYDYIRKIAEQTGETRSRVVSRIIEQTMNRPQTKDIGHLNNILAFIQEKTEKKDNEITPKQEVWEEYIISCKKDNFPICQESDFFKILKENIKLEEIRKNNKRFFKNIKIKTP